MKYVSYMKRENDMKPTETRVVFLMNGTEWRLVQLISRRQMHRTESGEIKAASGSVTIRELLINWLDDMAPKWFPILLGELKTQGIENDLTKYITECIRDFVESATVNSAPNVKAENLNSQQLRIRKESLQGLADLKASMVRAGFTETEYNALIKGEN